MRDSEPGEIVQGFRRAAKRKIPIELEPVASEGNLSVRHNLRREGTVRFS